MAYSMLTDVACTGTGGSGLTHRGAAYDGVHRHDVGSAAEGGPADNAREAGVSERTRVVGVMRVLGFCGLGFGWRSADKFVLCRHRSGSRRCWRRAKGIRTRSSSIPTLQTKRSWRPRCVCVCHAQPSAGLSSKVPAVVVVATCCLVLGAVRCAVLVQADDDL